MKKSLLTFLGGALALTSIAQIPREENVALVAKVTANWCPPCGQWGVPTFESMLDDNGTHVAGLALYASPRTDYSNEKFQNKAATDLATLITFGGFPSFSVNLNDLSDQNTNSQGGINTAGIKADGADSISQFKSAPVVVSPGMLYSISNDKVVVKTVTKFWADATGDYKVAVYLVEDGAIADQASRVNNQNVLLKDQVHHNVLRTSMTASTWGVPIPATSVKKDGTFEHTFEFDLKAAFTPSYADKPEDWDKTKLVPYAVIYKVEGGKHKFVNSATHYDYPASINNIAAVENVTVFPNPATEKTTIAFESNSTNNVNIIVTDNIGRTVYNSGNISVNNGRTLHSISTSNLAAGVYNVSVKSDNGVNTQRLNVVK